MKRRVLDKAACSMLWFAGRTELCHLHALVSAPKLTTAHASCHVITGSITNFATPRAR